MWPLLVLGGPLLEGELAIALAGVGEVVFVLLVLLTAASLFIDLARDMIQDAAPYVERHMLSWLAAGSGLMTLGVAMAVVMYGLEPNHDYFVALCGADILLLATVVPMAQAPPAWQALPRGPFTWRAGLAAFLGVGFLASIAGLMTRTQQPVPLVALAALACAPVIAGGIALVTPGGGGPDTSR